MEENKNQQAQVEDKLTYEQLTNVCNQLSERCRLLQEKLQEAQILLTSKRLDYLFTVIKFSQHFTPEFVTSCVKEIEESLTIPEENK